VLFLRDRPERLAEELGLREADLQDRLGRINCALRGVRAQRPQPRLDDKVITSWNGLMIAALARAALRLNEPRYAQAAVRAANSILATMRDSDARLLRTRRGGISQTPAFLEDYALLIEGLLALHAAACRFFPERAGGYLHEARVLIADTECLFSNPTTGGYFDVRSGESELFVRPRSTHDGAIPSGSSAMLLNLLECVRLGSDDPALERCLACLRSLSAVLARSPLSTANATRGLLALLTMDPSIAERVAAFGPAVASEEPESQFTPVEIYADAERIEVGPDHPAQVKLVLRIAEGYHVNAADPGEGTGLTPLRVAIKGGKGLAVYADYPPGEPYGPDGGVLVYRDGLEFPVVVERTGPVSGRPLLAVHFQACTDTECLPPMTAELDLAIDSTD
jgi:uncharacterized protein